MLDPRVSDSGGEWRLIYGKGPVIVHPQPFGEELTKAPRA